MKKIAAAALAVVWILSGCANAPPIGKSLPRNFDEANHAFDRRVQDRFPPGSSEADLRRELQVEGFKIHPVTGPGARSAQFVATREGNMGPTCNLDWDIYWGAADGRISTIFGTYYATCL